MAQKSRKGNALIKPATAKRLGLGLLALFALVWVFVLGVWLGQNLSPGEPPAQDLAALLRQDSPPGVSGETDLKPQLNYYRELERKDASPGTKTPRKRPARSGRYTVQVASFVKKTQAGALADKLASAGLDTFVRQSQVRGVGVRYRVRVGSYASESEAKAAASRLRGSHKVAAYVTLND